MAFQAFKGPSFLLAYFLLDGGGVIRNEKFVILKKTDVMQINDKAYVIINSSQMELTLSAFGHNEKISKKISKT